ncbi:hypothetical protein [Bradyrhizobium ottawaense]
MSPQHEADNDAEREGGGERCDWTVRNETLKLRLLFVHGLAELGQRRA